MWTRHKGNVAGTFVNAGFGNDKLMVEAEEGSSWIYKNKDHGMMSAVTPVLTAVTCFFDAPTRSG